MSMKQVCISSFHILWAGWLFRSLLVCQVVSMSKWSLQEKNVHVYYYHRHHTQFIYWSSSLKPSQPSSCNKLLQLFLTAMIWWQWNKYTHKYIPCFWFDLVRFAMQICNYILLNCWQTDGTTTRQQFKFNCWNFELKS